jgi:hypothetical protein
LREAGVILYPAANINQSLPDRTTNGFALHLVTERALKPATANIYVFEVRRFLSQRFETGSILGDELSPQDISRFMLCRAVDNANAFLGGVRLWEEAGDWLSDTTTRAT